jgi:hypothetical protein
MRLPAHPMNAMIKGQTVRVQGSGFNAIHGSPLAGERCALGSEDVTSQNCCRNKTKANVCGTGTPPNPPGDGSNCVAILDAVGAWRALPVTAVTPTTLIAEVPTPAVACVGEGYTQRVRVVKQTDSGPDDDFADYCRNSSL